jgi:hypothetical protein
MNSVPGVMQFESNLASEGSTSPRSSAFRSRISASLADRNLVQTYILTVNYLLYTTATVTFVKCCGLSQNYPPQ